MEIIESIESVITILAILLGGAYAIFKLGVFRDLKPHLTISQEVSHRFVGKKYVHLAVTAHLHNSSKVAIEIKHAKFRAQLISPLVDEEVERMYEETFSDDEDERLWWPTLEEIDKSWSDGELIVEPNETHSETYEFIVGVETETVMIYAYFHNPRHKPDSRVAEGWDATTVYDLVTERRR